MMWRVVLGGALLLLGCTGSELRPLGEALIVVDTNAPVPRLAARLRIDVYAEDGTWLDSRDFPMRRRADWPGSFSVFIDEATDERTALVRLRTYAEDKIRDYRGERFMARPQGAAPAEFAEVPPGDDQPRLVRDGLDITPASEPLPDLAIDRLIRVHLVDGERGSTRVLLDVACAGGMADVAGQRSCIDRDHLLESLVEAELESDMTIPNEAIGESDVTKTRGCNGEPQPSSGAPLYDGEVCVSGGMFFLGSLDFIGAVVAGGEEPEARELNIPGFLSVPERVAIVPPMFFDTYEVSVARWRRAVEVDGFVPPDLTPERNEGPLATTTVGLTDPRALCTWSIAPRGREEYPVNCLTWLAARSFCQFYGGDLPTEAQWEHAAAAADRDAETKFPWGADFPSCEQAVVGRLDTVITLGESNECIHLGFGPQPIGASLNDVTASGVVGIGGSMGEWVLDSFRSYKTNCWAAQGILDPVCWEDNAGYRSYRGGEWRGLRTHTRPTVRTGSAIDNIGWLFGFRCVRRA